MRHLRRTATWCRLSANLVPTGAPWPVMSSHHALRLHIILLFSIICNCFALIPWLIPRPACIPRICTQAYLVSMKSSISRCPPLPRVIIFVTLPGNNLSLCRIRGLRLFFLFFSQSSPKYCLSTQQRNNILIQAYAFIRCLASESGV